MATRQEKNLLNTTIGQVKSSNRLSSSDKQLLNDALNNLSKSTITTKVISRKKTNKTIHRQNLRVNTSTRTDCSTLGLFDCPGVLYGSVYDANSIQVPAVPGVCYGENTDVETESHCPLLCEFDSSFNGNAAWAFWIPEEGRHQNCLEATTCSNDPFIIDSSHVNITYSGNEGNGPWCGGGVYLEGLDDLIIKGACFDDTACNFKTDCGDLPDCENGEIAGTHVYHFDDVCCAEDNTLCSFNNGDVNQDGILNVLDIVGIVQYVLGTNEFDELQQCIGDVNGDGLINVIDIVGVVNNILNPDLGGEYCPDSQADNYNSSPSDDDVANEEMCLYRGCTDENAVNFGIQTSTGDFLPNLINEDDGSCEYDETSPIFITQPNSPISLTTEEDINLTWEVSDDYTPDEELQYWIFLNTTGNTNTISGLTLLTQDNNDQIADTVVGTFDNNFVGESVPVNGIINFINNDLNIGTYYYQLLIIDNSNNMNVSNIVQVSISQVDILGCTDPNATNFNQEANVDDGSCIYVDNTDFIQINDIDISGTTVIISGSITDVGDDYSGDSYNVTIQWDPSSTEEEVTLNGNLTFVVENTYGTYVTNQQITINLTGTDVSDILTLTLDIPQPDLVDLTVEACTDSSACNPNPLCTNLNIDCISNAELCTYPSLCPGTSNNPIYKCYPSQCPEVDDISPITGCTNPNSLNCNPDAVEDDGSCNPVITGCTNPNATNYYCIPGTYNNFNTNAILSYCTDINGDIKINDCGNAVVVDDGTCTIEQITGCTNIHATNYNADAVEDDNSCQYGLYFGGNLSEAYNDAINPNETEGEWKYKFLTKGDSALHDNMGNTFEIQCPFNQNNEFGFGGSGIELSENKIKFNNVNKTGCQNTIFFGQYYGLNLLGDDNLPNWVTDSSLWQEAGVTFTDTNLMFVKLKLTRLTQHKLTVSLETSSFDVLQLFLLKKSEILDLRRASGVLDEYNNSSTIEETWFNYVDNNYNVEIGNNRMFGNYDTEGSLINWDVITAPDYIEPVRINDPVDGDYSIEFFGNTTEDDPYYLILSYYSYTGIDGNASSNLLSITEMSYDAPPETDCAGDELSDDCSDPNNTIGCASYDTTTNCSPQTGEAQCNPLDCFPNTPDVSGVGNCHCKCVGGGTGIDVDDLPSIDICGQCHGGYLITDDASVPTFPFANRSDLGCGCFEDKPILYFVDSDNDAYVDDNGLPGNPFNGDTPNPNGEVDATQPYYFCIYEDGVEIDNITFAYIDNIEWPNPLGKELIQPPSLNFTYPQWKPAYPNFVPDWSSNFFDIPLPIDINLGSVDNPQIGNWYGTPETDNSMNDIGGQILGCTDIEAINYNPNANVDNGSCRYAENPLENTNLPIVQLVGPFLTIYKSELDEQVSITDEFKKYGTVAYNFTSIDGLTKFEITPTNSTGEPNNTTDLSLNLPISETYVMRKIEDKTLSKTALTNYLFDEMGNKIIDFKFVDLITGTEYRGVYLIYAKTSLNVLGYGESDVLKQDPNVVITEIMWNDSDDIDLDDYFVIKNVSDTPINIANYKVGGYRNEVQPIFVPYASSDTCNAIPISECGANNNSPYTGCGIVPIQGGICSAMAGDAEGDKPTPYEASLLAFPDQEINLAKNDYIIFAENPDDFKEIYNIPDFSSANLTNCIFAIQGNIDKDEKVILYDSDNNIIDEVDLNIFTTDENCTLMEETSGTGNAIRIKHPFCPTTVCNNFVPAPPAGDVIEGYEPSFENNEYVLFDTIGDSNVCQLYEPTLLLNDGSGWETTLPEESSHTIIGLDETNYGVFRSSVNINSYLDYVLLEELKMNTEQIINTEYNPSDNTSPEFITGDDEQGGYKNVNVVTTGGKYSFGTFDLFGDIHTFINGFDVKQCQGEEYKVSSISNDSQGWLFDNIDTNLSQQIKQFIIESQLIVEDPTGGGVERIDTDDGDILQNQNFITDLITRWNELRGDVLSDENILYRIDYYYYYLNGRAVFQYQTQDDIITKFDNEIKNLKDWLLNRIYWIDHNIRRIKQQVDEVEAVECTNNPLIPTNPHGISYCNDVDAEIYNLNSNFNDGTCKYVLIREIQFQLDTQMVGYPKIEKVRLNILKKNGIDFDESYEMNETIENIWSYALLDFLPGDIIEYNYTKETADVYNVRTGALETDKVRLIQIRDENQIEIQDTFNDFINEFQETNLPIIKINTNTFNDIGFVNQFNTNLFYCPTYRLPNDYLADGPPSEICDMMKNYIDWHNDGKPIAEDGTSLNPGGYYESKIVCEVQTECDVDCIDGTNIQDEPKISGYMELIYNGEGAINNISDEPQLQTKIGIEARGFSSRGFAKKQYAVELQKTKSFPQCDDDAVDFNLFCNGFQPEEDVDYGDECIFNIENDFVLLGPFRDRTYMRNALSYELWDRMDKIGSNSKFFEFILNDVYMGLYVMFEKPKIDVPHRVPIDVEILDNESVNNNYDGGWMIKVESGAEQDFFVGYDSYTKYEYYDPTLEITGEEGDETSDTEADDARQKIQDIIKEFERRVDIESQESVNEVVHIPDFVDYWLIQEFARNNEGFTRSQYWHSFGNYGENQGYDNNKIYISYVWDMNHSFGATIPNYDGWATQNFFAIPQVWSNLYKHTWFQEQIYNRYLTYKGLEIISGQIVSGGIPIFKVGEINKLIDKFSSEILEYNAVNRDQKRWYDGEIDDFNIYVKNFRRYILQRISWMDIHICSGEFIDDENISPTNVPFVSSDVDNTIFNQITFNTCSLDPKNSNFIAIYNPFEGQTFDINDIGDEFQIEIIISLNLLPQISDFDDPIHVTILDVVDPANPVAFFNNIEIDNDGYVRLFWNTYDSRISGKLIGDYTITATFNFSTSVELEENVKNFSIRNIGQVSGCTNPNAINYDLFAEIDDGSCKFQQDCNEKYNVSQFITDIIQLYPGYNTISYPLDFTGVDLDLFLILENSYYDNNDVLGSFEENDYITAFFDDVVYTATYMGGQWIPSTDRGFSLNELSKGIGFILYVSKGGRIIWDIPREELS